MELGERGQEICRQAEQAFKRGSLDSFWQTSAEIFYPERADFTTTLTPGEDFASSLYASEPVLFRRDFCNDLGASLRPAGKDWFQPRVRNDQINELSTVQQWLQPRGRTLRAMLYDPKSQFERAMTLGDHDYGTFGNCVSSCEERDDRTGFRFRTWHLRNCAWRENYDGEIDTMFRKVMVSVRNLCANQRTKGWKLHSKVSDKLDRNPDDMVGCLHVLMPIWDYDYSRKKKRYDWISAYVDQDNKWIMSDKEVPEFNYLVSRWYLVDKYGFSPCVTAALPDSRSLQTIMWSLTEAAEKAVEPPVIAQNEAVLGGIDLRAGAVTWIDQRYDERTGEAVRALQLGSSPQFGDMLRQLITNNINSAFYLNKLFLPPPASQPMTAEEAALRNAEYLRSVEPIISPAQIERNGQMLDLTMRMAMRAGYWGDLTKMPEELMGDNVDFSYDNPVEDARRAAKVQSYRTAISIVEATKQFADPASAAQFNGDYAFRDAISGVGQPDWLFGEKESQDAITKERQQNAVSQAAAEVAASSQASQAVQGAQAKAAGRAGTVPVAA